MESLCSLSYTSSNRSVAEDQVHSIWRHCHMLIHDLVQERQSVDTTALLKGFQIQLGE